VLSPGCTVGNYGFVSSWVGFPVTEVGVALVSVSVFGRWGVWSDL